MIEITHLLRLADTLAEATSIKEVTLSHRLFGDSKKLGALRSGSDITVGRYNSAIRWFSDNWPEGCDWPADVPRPSDLEAAE